MSIERFDRWFEILTGAEILVRTHQEIVEALGGAEEAEKVGVKAPAHTRVLLSFVRAAEMGHNWDSYMNPKATRMKAFLGLAGLPGGLHGGQNLHFQTYLTELMKAWFIEDSDGELWKRLACAAATIVCKEISTEDIPTAEKHARDEADERHCAFP